MSKNLTGREAAALRAEQEQRERERAAREAAERAGAPENGTAAPAACPYCGKAMEPGKICLGNTVRPFWQPMNTGAVPLTFLKPSGGVALRHTGALSPDLPAWLCRNCGKVILDTD